MSEHFIMKCRYCGKIIAQCRCPDPNKTVEYGVCNGEDCQELAGMNNTFSGTLKNSTKPAAPRITPDEGHVIKATAWDAMRVAFSIHAETADGEIQQGMAKNILLTMDSLLEQVGNKYSNAKTWGAIMPRKYNDELLCRCVACGTVTAKADWKHYIGVVFICPNCGCLQDPSIGNEQPPEVPELKTYADPEPTPPKSASAKPAAKK